MPSSHLKRAERAIQSIRDQAELPPETADALRRQVHRWPIVSVGKPQPNGGNGTAKPEMTKS
jgi:hypothetical protein